MWTKSNTSISIGGNFSIHDRLQDVDFRSGLRTLFHKIVRWKRLIDYSSTVYEFFLKSIIKSTIFNKFNN